MSKQKRPTTECSKCQRSVANNNFARHKAACFGFESKVWNSGKSKETDVRIAQAATKISIALTGKPGRKLSQEERDHLSKKRIEWLDANPDKIPYLLNHSSRESYPEKYWNECLQGLSIQREHRVKRYALDFANPSNLRYLEIDGEQHYVDTRIVEHDRKRTSTLIELGWTGMRIRWSHFQKLDMKAKKAEVEKVKQFLLQL